LLGTSVVADGVCGRRAGNHHHHQPYRFACWDGPWGGRTRLVRTGRASACRAPRVLGAILRAPRVAGRPTRRAAIGGDPPRRWSPRSGSGAPARTASAAARSAVGATAGEQSWHRRARRRRQTDRAIIAVAAARRRLAAHHGGGGVPVAPMPPRRSGSGGASGQSSRKQFLLECLQREKELEAGAQQGGGRGRANAGGGPRGREASGASARGRAAGGARNSSVRRGVSGGSEGEERSRPGDWRCGPCGFSPNVSWRRSCF
jgi:hypothetical protein